MNKGTLSLLFLILLIQLHLSKTTSLKIGGCTSEDCLINNDLESEFLMSSHVARMLLNQGQTQTGKTANNNGAAVNCPIVKGYRTCLPSQNGGGPNNRCGTFNRVC
ncbi:unnamed protein product [Lathyrus oleraceus]